MKKRILIIGCIIAILATGCNDKSKDVKQDETVKQQETVAKELSSENHNEKDLLEKILLTHKINSLDNEGEQLLQVEINNSSDKIFNGKMYIDGLDKEGPNIKEGGNIIGDCIIDVENLKPGNSTLCNINIKTTIEEDIYINHGFLEKSFTDDIVAVGVIDEESSKELSDDIKDSFGNEYFTAEWYPSIKNIEVYSTEDQVKYIIVIATDHEKEIGNIVFGNYVYDATSKYSKITVIDEEGNTIFNKSK